MEMVRLAPLVVIGLFDLAVIIWVILAVRAFQKDEKYGEKIKFFYFWANFLCVICLIYSYIALFLKIMRL